MSRYKVVEEQVFADLRNAGKKLTNPHALTAWMIANKLGPNAMSAATGASTDDCSDKYRAGGRDNMIGTPVYERLSRPLTQGNFPGTRSVWEHDAPVDYIQRKLIADYEALPTSVETLARFDNLYRKVLNREIDLEGFGFWLWKSIADKMTTDELEGHLRASDEAQGK